MSLYSASLLRAYICALLLVYAALPSEAAAEAECAQRSVEMPSSATSRAGSRILIFDEGNAGGFNLTLNFFEVVVAKQSRISVFYRARVSTQEPLDRATSLMR